VPFVCADPPVLIMPDIDFPDGQFEVNKAYPFRVPDLPQGCLVRWTFDYNDTLSGPAVSYTFRNNGTHVATVRVYRAGQEDWCYVEFTKQFEADNPKPYLATLPLRADTFPTQWHLRWWAWLIAILPLLASAFYLWRWWRRLPAGLLPAAGLRDAARGPRRDVASEGVAGDAAGPYPRRRFLRGLAAAAARYQPAAQALPDHRAHQPGLEPAI
jgi:hypothetical protein